MEHDKTLGDRLIEQRGEASQDDIADRIGVAQATYQRWERDLSFPGADSFKALCEFLGVDIRELGALIALGQQRKFRRSGVK